MSKNYRGLLAMLLVICMLMSMVNGVFAAPSATDIITTPTGYTSASQVSYQTEGGYIVNWGARGEDCLFLSNYAQSFYTGTNSYATLSQKKGGTSTSNAPTSALYTALQTLMADNHTYFTKYGSTSSNDCKYIYQYTDCVSSNTAYVSTLYRGLTVDGTWASGTQYNQEHIWPQSKCIGSESTDIGDIMHLRPSNPSENSSRGNKAYGEGSTYYDPGISVRGDCARTLLYMYVRWGNTDYMWGTDGVMESLDILLRWMEEDPVDTWEMGRNDAVQSITGTRNVFVDYPEYAWLLFGQTVPTGMNTPSNNDGIGSGGSGGGTGDSGTTTPSTTAELVTSVSQLSAGDRVVIVASDYDYAVSTTQNTNNRGQTAVTKSGTTVSFGEDTQIFTLESGTVSGSYAFYADSKYLCAASSSANYLRSTETLSDQASWNIAIDSATGTFSVVANGSYSRNVIRYNVTSGLFSCYSASNSQKDILLYKITDTTGGGSGGSDAGSSASVGLITDASTLRAGDQIIVAALDYDYALSTTQNSNNRGQAAITKSGVSVTYGADVQIITLEAGSVAGTFGFRVGEGQYLYAPSSTGNQLKTTDSLIDNGAWSISIDSATGSANIVASGTSSRNTLRYNTSSKLFSCYAVSNTQKDICIYKVGEEAPTVDYYLFGYINGANYACEEDYTNMGDYKFVDGTLTATFNQDSYIGVKTTNNTAWYMTQSYVTDTSAVFYNTNTGAAEKMFVPGNQELTFTLRVNSDDTVSLSYTTAACDHSYTSKVTTAATCTTKGVRTYTCSKCSDSYTESIAATGHSYTSKVTAAGCETQGYTTYTCSACGSSYVGNYTAATGHSYTSKVTTAATCTANGVRTYTCSKCSDSYTESITATGHSYTSKVTAAGCETQGYTTYTCSACGSSYVGNYTAATGHSYTSKVTTAATCTTSGVRTYTCSKCSDRYTESIPATGHQYSNGKCAICGATDPNCTHSYTSKVTTAATCSASGVRTYTCSKCGDTYSEAISALGHNYSSVVTAPTCTAGGYTTYTCTRCQNSYTGNNTAATGHSYTAEVHPANCTSIGYTVYTCGGCGYRYQGDYQDATPHNFVNGSCSLCGAPDPDASTDQTYYLFGYINGANYACEEDYENMGIYKFASGKLTTTFTADSYVAVKTEGNAAWYMTNGWQGNETTSVTLYNTNTGITADKLYVPGGVEVTFTLTENSDGTLTLSYISASTTPSTQPTIALKYPTLTFEDVILMNVYFSAESLEDVVEMGLVTYTSSVTSADVNTANAVVPGYTYSEADGLYCATTNGIAAKDLGDELYFAVYAKLADGTYYYTKVVSYSPSKYAYSSLSTGSDAMKPIVVAMLNYGAAAQTYFNYKTDSLVNANLTTEQKALVESYRSDMIATVAAASTTKQGALVSNGGFSRRYPTVSFEGAFCINYYCVPSAQPVNGITMYYWDQAAFDANSVLTTKNATAAIPMTLDSATGEYHAAVEGIAAKDLDKGVYVAFVYSNGTTTYSSGILAYSIGTYCSVQASGTGATAELAKATAVYGYYANELFN